MRVTKIICNKCGEEIIDNPIRYCAEFVSREDVDISVGYPVFNDALIDMDFCKKCAEEIFALINKKADAPKAKPVAKLKTKPAVSATPRNRIDYDKISNMLNEGKTSAEIAKITGMEKTAVYNAVWHIRKQGKADTAPANAVDVNSDNCKTCIYYEKVNHFCDYFSKTGELRHDPKGKCTHRKIK